MSNVFTYIIDLHDKFTNVLNKADGALAKTDKNVLALNRKIGLLEHVPTAGLSRFGDESKTTLDKATDKTNKLIERNKVLEHSYSDLSRQMHHTVATLDKLNVKQTGVPAAGNSKPGGGGGGMLNMLGGAKTMLAGAGAGLALSLIPAAKDFVSDSISKGLERQQIQTSFNVLAGDEQKGSALTKQLVDLQNDTILGSEVFSNAQTMMGFGFDSSEVAENLKMLGDVSMGDAGKLGSLTLAFSQVRAGGKLLGNDLLQFINAGFNPLQTMSDKTGKSIGALKDEMGKGLISFDMVRQAFKDATSEGGRFDNMLAKIAETPAGKIQQLSGQWDEFKVNAGSAFMPLVSMALDFAAKFMPLIEGLIQPLANGVQKIADYINSLTTSTGGWMDYLNVIRELFEEHYLPYLGAIWDCVKNIVSKVANWVSSSELVKDVFKAITTYMGFVYDAVAWVVKQLTWVFNNVVMPILDGIEWAYRKIKELIGSPVKVEFDAKPKPTGIEPPGTPGALNLTGGNATGGSATGGSSAGKTTANNITTGGSKTTHITLNLGNLVQTMTINSGNIKEGAEKIRDIVQDELTRALLIAQANI